MKTRIDIFLMIVIIMAVIFILTASVNHAKIPLPNETMSLKIPISDFKTGDIIFRDGRGIISSIFRKLSLTDKQFSHAGIIHIENEKRYVYHLIGGEDNPGNVMQKESLESFCSKSNAGAFGIYRSDLPGNLIDRVATCYFSRAIMFDLQFNLDTDDKMYCTEMVYKILTAVSGNKNYIPLTVVNEMKYVACDNIFLSPHCKKIFSMNYSTHEK